MNRRDCCSISFPKGGNLLEFPRRKEVLRSDPPMFPVPIAVKTISCLGPFRSREKSLTPFQSPKIRFPDSCFAPIPVVCMTCP